MNGRIVDINQLHLGFNSTGETAKNSHKISVHSVGLVKSFSALNTSINVVKIQYTKQLVGYY